jgi:hypothetical protein
MTAREDRGRSSQDDLLDRAMIVAATQVMTDTLGLPDEDSTAPVTPARVAALLRGQASRIVANWVLRAANLPAFRAVPNLALDQLQDAIPALLDAALTAVASSDPTMDPEPLSRAIELAEEHGRTRAKEGFGIGVLLTEYQHLRMEVWTALWRVGTPDPATMSVPRELQIRINSTFDSLAAAAAESWVDYRLSAASTTPRR